jgi:hypothetical protein
MSASLSLRTSDQVIGEIPPAHQRADVVEGAGAEALLPG